MWRSFDRGDAGFPMVQKRPGVPMAGNIQSYRNTQGLNSLYYMRQSIPAEYPTQLGRERIPGH